MYGINSFFNYDNLSYSVQQITGSIRLFAEQKIN